MPCDAVPKGMTEAQRRNQIKDALDRLRKSLTDGDVKVKIGPSGAIMFEGWTKESRSYVTDVCAYRMLSAEGSVELRMAISRAQAMSGRMVNQNAIASGMHSHDGQNWSSH